MRRLRTETATADYFNFHLELNASFIRYAEVEVWRRMRREINAAIFEILIEGRYSSFNRNLPCISCFIFHQSFCKVVIGRCNRTVGCNWTPVIGQLQLKKYHTKSAQLNPPTAQLITITIATTTYPGKRKLVNFKNGVMFSFFTLSLPEMSVENVFVVFKNISSLVCLQTELDSTRPYCHISIIKLQFIRL